jgi:hypothetical protein
MADEEQLKILRQGVAGWNEWREKNPELFLDLNRADPREVDPNKADLFGAILTRVDFYGADLSWANLSGAQLQGCIPDAYEAPVPRA